MAPADNAVIHWGNEYALSQPADIIGSRTKAAQFHRAGKMCLAEIELMSARTAVSVLQRLHSLHNEIYDELLELERQSGTLQ